ncbi:MAG: response regulator [Chloroflexi bacterium]|nr:response regulator [Chloroflexota bacterium]
MNRSFSSTGSLSFKIIGAILLISLLLFPFSAYVNIQNLREALDLAYLEKAEAIARALDVNIRNMQELRDESRLLANVQKSLWLDPDVLSIDINLPDQDTMIVYVADQNARIGKQADADNLEAYQKNIIIHRIIQRGAERVLRVITPIHVAKQIVGTYQIELTLEAVDSQINVTIGTIALNTLLMTGLFVIFLYLFLKANVINPVSEISAGVRTISQGDLDSRVSIRSSDEIGVLAGAFNQMTVDLKKSREETKQLISELSSTNIQLENEIKQRQEKEDAMRQAQKLESLGVMAGGIAHDFNNLLTAMLAQSSLVQAKLSPHDPAFRHIGKVVEAAERAANLTQQLLAYSGRSQFEVRPINLNDAIQESLHLLEVAFPKTVQLKMELTETLPLFMGDLGQIQQVLMNLIINAAESIDDHVGTVTAKTAVTCVDQGDVRLPYTDETLPPDDYVILEVSDTGSGMEEDTLSKIFDPFFSTKSTGRGLGLAAVIGIVRGHNGGLQVDTVLGGGTTFRLFFPVSHERYKEETAAELLSSSEELPGLVLVVDDEEPVREAVTDILALEGVQVIAAADGLEGLALYRQRQEDIHLVILDLSMPGMDGEATLKQLREISSDVPVLLSSGYSESEIASRFAELDFVSFLPKPYRRDELVQTVQHHLKEHGRSSLE